MEAWIIWLIMALVLIVIEVATQMVWTLCMAIGCLGALVASLCGVAPSVQAVILAAISMLSFFTLMPLFKRWHERHGRSRSHDDRTGMDALLGRKAIVTERILPGMTGRVRIDGDNWQVRAPGTATTIETGNEVVVMAYEGNILSVECRH